MWMPGRRCTAEQGEEGELLHSAVEVMMSYEEQDDIRAYVYTLLFL